MKNLILLTIWLLLFLSCNEKVDKPKITITNTHCVTYNSALVEVVADWGDYSYDVLAKDICLSENSEPTIENRLNCFPIRKNNSDTIIFQIPSLEPGKTYYVRSFVDYESGIGGNWINYSNTYKFTTSHVEYFTDPRDGKKYPIVKIGNKTWFAENLAYDVPGESFWYQNNPDKYGSLGKLYTYTSALKAVPPGWHVSTDEDWMDLERVIGMPDSLLQKKDDREADVAGKIKQVGANNWFPSINFDTNETGFSALAAGYGMLSTDTGTMPDKNFKEQSTSGFFLTTTLDSTNKFVLIRILHNNKRGIMRQFIYKETCFSVRCVKD